MALTKISGNVIQQPFNIGSIDGLINTGISTFQGQVISTRANSTTTGGGQIYLNGATGNRIDFNTNGVAAPSFTTRSAGTKIVLYPAGTPATQVDYGFGVENFSLWSSVPNTSSFQFKWYAGTTNVATLFGTGELVLGTTTKTGTADQDLQVTGGAYVSGNLGIGTTNPQTALHLGGGGNIRLNRSDNARSSLIFHDNNGFNINANTSGDDVIINAGNASGRILLQNNSSTTLIAQSGTVLVGTATSTGTASQPLQVTGGAYISGNLGVGITNPSYKLDLQSSSNDVLSIKGGTNATFMVFDNNSLDDYKIGGVNVVAPFVVYNNTDARYEMVFDGTGNVLIGSQTSTGTASQPLQVTGGAYVSGNLGIGTTNPTSKLQVIGSTDLNKLNLSGISSSISSTAVDVFVYDTRKDSDGGAWRKRTQNTSWYNETLNTATRGSRKDFPAVAVIVATTTTVTIYDGDDPDMPMWMVFQSSGYGMSGVYMFNAGNVVNSSIYALNGILVGGQYQASDTYGSPIINFISEKVVRMDAGTSEGGLWLGNIADRNSGKGYASQASTGQGYVIISSIINDVAMTVLPNAPIDPSTGLPVPTIACLVGETQVTLENGETKRIDQIKVGEVVKTLEGNHKVLNWFDQGIKETIELEFDNGTKLVCTPDHKIRTTIGWIEAGDLNEEHEIVSL